MIDYLDDLVDITCHPAIMQYRVSAMYRHSRKVIAILVLGFSLEVLAGVIIAVTGFVSMTSTSSTLSISAGKIQTINTEQELLTLGHLYLCHSATIPKWYFILWVPMIVFETLLLAMALYPAISHAQDIKLIRELGVADSAPALSYLLMRDSILFPMM